MKHIFIVNPKSGQGDIQKNLINELEKRGLAFYLTRSPGDGEEYIKRVCAAGPSEKIRFYACGGDGTLNEVVNGVFGFKNAEAAAMPIMSKKMPRKMNSRRITAAHTKFSHSRA